MKKSVARKIAIATHCSIILSGCELNAITSQLSEEDGNKVMNEAGNWAKQQLDRIGLEPRYHSHTEIVEIFTAQEAV